MIITDLKILRNKSTEIIIDNRVAIKVGDRPLEVIIEELEKELKESEIKGVGLSAIQIGIPKRVCIIRTEKLSLDLYNAKITSGSEPFVFKGEGCLSVPNKYIDTNRMNKITVKNGDGKIHELEGFEAVVVSHEIDHWNGLLFTDRGVENESTKN